MRIHVLAPVLFAGTLLGTVASAATVRVQLTLANGQPAAGAVAMIDSAAYKPGPIRFPWANVMAQQNIMFQPHVLIVPVGAAVTFPNKDQVRHHVYSFSKPKKFELKLYGRDETHAITFDKPGVVALGCNIHDAMSAFVIVVDTPYAAQADANGRVVLTDVPAGAAKLRVWLPSIKAPGNQVAQGIAVAGAAFATTVALPTR